MAVSTKSACKSVAEWREGSIDVTSRQTPIPDIAEETETQAMERGWSLETQETSCK